MISHPKTLPMSATVGDVREVLDNLHVHLVLLTEAGALRGTLIRDDVAGHGDETPARALARLDGRTIGPRDTVGRARQMLADGDARRLAVVDDDGELLGLLCLKRRLTGFCSDSDVAARQSDHGRP